MFSKCDGRRSLAIAKWESVHCTPSRRQTHGRRTRSGGRARGPDTLRVRRLLSLRSEFNAEGRCELSARLVWVRGRPEYEALEKADCLLSR